MMRISTVVVMFIMVLAMCGLSVAAGHEDILSSDHSGSYLGAFAGYSWTDLDYSGEYTDGEINRDFDGFNGGTFLGYNHQINNMIFGIEADMGFGDLSEGAHVNSDNNSWSAFEINWDAHVRARLGCAHGATLYYLAGGLAVADVNIDDIDDGYGEDDATHLGWTAGVGIEHALTNNLRLRGEYLYDDYSSERYSIPEVGEIPYLANSDFSVQAFRIGLSYSF